MLKYCLISSIVGLIFVNVIFSRVIVKNQKRLDYLIEVVTTDEDMNYSRDKMYSNYINDLKSKLAAQKEKISILDESVGSKNKRWARIKKVRKAIQDTAYNTPAILELTSISASVVDYSDEYDVPIPLILGIIKRESDFQRKALSKANAKGLMQVMSETGKEISGDVGRRHYSLYNIRNNVQFGTYYIRKMLDALDGNVDLAVRSYNCGLTYVKKVQSGDYKNYPEETVNYLDAVLEWKVKYEAMGL